MADTIILDRTRRLLEEAPLQGRDLDTKVLNLLKSEYLRQLAQYKRTDLLMTEKYHTTFADFNTLRITKQKDYSWDIESDAMTWESAISGMSTIKRKLAELQE